MTTLSLSHPYITKNRTKPYLAKLVKDFTKDYKGNRSQYFSLKIIFMKGCTADTKAEDMQ